MTTELGLGIDPEFQALFPAPENRWPPNSK
jgi:hypothetical protein